jgi:hypothetical protein
MRLSFHHIFNEAILEINKNPSKTFVVADGQFRLKQNITGQKLNEKR